MSITTALGRTANTLLGELILSQRQRCNHLNIVRRYVNPNFDRNKENENQWKSSNQAESFFHSKIFEIYRDLLTRQDSNYQKLDSKIDSFRTESLQNYQKLDSKIDSFRTESLQNYQKLDTKIDSFRTESLQNYQKLDAKIDQVSQKLDEKIDQVSQKLDAKIDQVSQKLDEKIDQVSQKLDAKIDQVSQKLDAKIDQVSQKIDTVAESIKKSNRNNIVLVAALIGILVGTLEIKEALGAKGKLELEK